MDKEHVCIACPLFDDNYDFAGNHFEEEAKMIQAKVFVKDDRMEKGLYGYLWGSTEIPPRENILKGKWALVKVEKNEGLILLSKLRNTVKFERGMIICKGKIKEIAKKILYLKEKEKKYFSSQLKKIKNNLLMGTEEWNKQNKISL